MMSLQGVNHLRRADPRWGDWIDRLGVLSFPEPPLREPYIALLESIAHQQLAGAAARTIWARVMGLFEDGALCPKRLAGMPDEHLRGAGLSRAKAASMKAICAAVNAGHIPSAALIAQMPDPDLYAQLTQIRGVGPWTVDMLMMFTLRRPDIMPATDYGVRKGLKILYRKRALPTPKQVLQFSEKWRPHRSLASLYLWRIADTAETKKTKKKKQTKQKKKSLSK